MNGQPNQGGIAQLAGGMGGSPTLGGAPQTPPMPQGGQKSPQPTPQGGLPPDLLKALAMARVKKLQDAAKRDLEIQMAQQQAASGEDKKTVVQQMEEGVEKEAMDETQQALMKKLSGGIAQEAKQSMQPQGQPMSGGIAAAPGANQAAQPDAMAAGGIVAFASGAGGDKNKGAIPAAINQDEGYYKEPGSDLLISEEERPVAATLQPRRHILSGLPAILEKQITQEPSGDAEMEKYQRLVAVDPELAAQLKADKAAERAALQTRATREPSVYDRLSAFANVAPRGGQTWTMAGSEGARNINKLEKEYENERLTALGGLRSLSKADLDESQAKQKEAYGISKGEKTEQRRTLDNALTVAGQLYGNDSTTMAAIQAASAKNPLEIQVAADMYLKGRLAQGDNRDRAVILAEGLKDYADTKARTDPLMAQVMASLIGSQRNSETQARGQDRQAWDNANKRVDEILGDILLPQAKEYRRFAAIDAQNKEKNKQNPNVNLPTNNANTYKNNLVDEQYNRPSGPSSNPDANGSLPPAAPGTPAQSVPPNTNRASPAVDFRKLPK